MRRFFTPSYRVSPPPSRSAGDGAGIGCAKGRIALLACVWLAIAAWSGAAARAADHYLTIGTGGVTGVYFPAGGAICRLVNLNYKEHGINCSVQSTPGSIYNLTALRKGEMELAAAQSDWQYHAYHGTGDFLDAGADPKLRSVFSLHGEPFTVLARDGSGIETFEDLRGKRVNVGNPGSGMRATMNVVMHYEGWRDEDFESVGELNAVEQGAALCEGKVDAVIYTAGHPNGAVQEVTGACKAKLIGVTGPAIDKLLRENPFYAPVVIPGGMYEGNEEDTATFGVRTTFVSRETVDPELIYQAVKALFDNFDNFKTLHPVFAALEPKNLVYEGNSAPLHDGAIRYYRERGWLDPARDAPRPASASGSGR